SSLMVGRRPVMMNDGKRRPSERSDGVIRDMLVQGGTVVDGTGGPSRRADVRVRDGLIVEIAEGLAVDGEPVVDAGGALVAPGFIDTHTHFDPSLFWDHYCDPM